MSENQQAIIATREQLVVAFDNWLAEYREDPELFGDYDDSEYDTKSYGEESADTLIRLIDEAQAQEVPNGNYS